MGDISKLEVGDDVHAIGHPEGEVWTYTTGTISQIRPKYEWKDEKITHSATVIQTQTAINPGNSGGPLLNNNAQVIGINSFRMEGEGLNYAIAGDTIETFLKRPTNRVAEAPAKANGGISRVERFGDNIAGAYMESQTPPPDAWLVLRGDQDMPEYAVMGASTKDKLDTVFKGVDPKWRQLVYYYDLNCDGVVDLIGYSSAGSSKIDRYQRPETEIRLDSLAPEVARAFETGLIPYHQSQILSLRMSYQTKLARRIFYRAYRILSGSLLALFLLVCCTVHEDRDAAAGEAQYRLPASADSQTFVPENADFRQRPDQTASANSYKIAPSTSQQSRVSASPENGSHIHVPARGCWNEHDAFVFPNGNRIEFYPYAYPYRFDHLLIHYANGDEIWGQPTYTSPDCPDSNRCQKAASPSEPDLASLRSQRAHSTKYTR